MFGYIVKKINLIFFSSIVLFSLAFSQYLQTSGTRIVDGDGNTVILRGVAFGGWQVPEGYMFQIPGSGSPTTIREKIVNLVGEVEADKFYDKFERNFVQEKDIEMLASWGFNSIRLPLHYKALSPIRGEYSEKGFAVIDSVIGWCKKYNLYVQVIPNENYGPEKYSFKFYSDDQSEKSYHHIPKSDPEKNRIPHFTSDHSPAPPTRLIHV